MRVVNVLLNQMWAHFSFLSFVDATWHFMVFWMLHLWCLHNLWLGHRVILHTQVVKTTLRRIVVSLITATAALTSILAYELASVFDWLFAPWSLTHAVVRGNLRCLWSSVAACRPNTLIKLAWFFSISINDTDFLQRGLASWVCRFLSSDWHHLSIVSRLHTELMLNRATVGCDLVACGQLNRTGGLIVALERWRMICAGWNVVDRIYRLVGDRVAVRWRRASLLDRVELGNHRSAKLRSLAHWGLHLNGWSLRESFVLFGWFDLASKSLGLGVTCRPYLVLCCGGSF